MSEKKLELYVKRVNRGPRCNFNWKCKKGSTINLGLKETGRTPLDINLCEEHAKLASDLLFQATTGSNIGDLVGVLDESKTQLDKVVAMNKRLYAFYEGLLNSSKKNMSKALIKELMLKDGVLDEYKGPDTVPDLCHYFVHRAYKVVQPVEKPRLVIEAGDGEYTFEQIKEAAEKELSFDIKAIDAVSETIYPLTHENDECYIISVPDPETISAAKEFKAGMKVIIEGIEILIADVPVPIIPDALGEDDLDALLANADVADISAEDESEEENE